MRPRRWGVQQACRASNNAAPSSAAFNNESGLLSSRYSVHSALAEFPRGAPIFNPARWPLRRIGYRRSWKIAYAGVIRGGNGGGGGEVLGTGGGALLVRRT